MNHVSLFDSLSKDIQKVLYEKRWNALTPIQELAIPAILQSDQHIVITAGTASGKTEAAFLPILTKVQNTARERLKVLYVSPIRALINDQFERIEGLCKYMEIPVHKWHGDVDFSKKKQLLERPSGILQITPESLEALFVNRPYAVYKMFKDLEFLVIDEVHAFLGRDRGVHLQSLLARIAFYSLEQPRIVALSATLGDATVVKSWISPQDPSRVTMIEADSRLGQGEAQSEATQREEPRILFALDYASKNRSSDLFRNDSTDDPAVEQQLPASIIQDIRELTRNHSAMIFCNSRSHAEELSVRLNELVELERKQRHTHHFDGATALYLTHHSSIDRTEREFVEQTMRSSDLPRSVICTSSMELGIDIGQVDLVIQVDATWSVSSLKQRVGRSGRRQGKDRILQMYAMDSMGLLQAIAVTELMKEGWVEAGAIYPTPYDVLFHQILSICSEHNGLTRKQLLDIIHRLGPFASIAKCDIEQLLDYALDHDFLERLAPDQWIVGVNGERILRSIEFYSIFKTPEEYEVYDGSRRLGTIEKNGYVDIGSCLMLGGRVWSIVTIDEASNQVHVVPSSTGSPPRYSGMSVKREHTIAEKMAEVLYGSDTYSYLMPAAREQLQLIRERYASLQLKPHQRIVETYLDGRLVCQLFAGTDYQRTLQWMIRALGHQARINELGHLEITLNEKADTGMYSLSGTTQSEAAKSMVSSICTEIFEQIMTGNWTADMLLPYVKDHERMQTKYSIYLPNAFRDCMHMSSEIDVEGTLEYLKGIEFVFV